MMWIDQAKSLQVLVPVLNFSEAAVAVLKLGFCLWWGVGGSINLALLDRRKLTIIDADDTVGLRAILPY